MGVLVMSMSQILLAQNRTISGQVIEDESGFGLPGVTVLVKGTTTGVVTDMDGNYAVEATPNDILVFSFVGFETTELQVGQNSTLNVTLYTSIQALAEVVVTGYGQTQNRATISTAVQTIDSKVIEDRPIARLEQAIQGSIPAVVIVKESGSPGAPLTIRMRGVGTAGNATPLILVNGVQVPDMNFINPNDIQGITVLKDAASSAIYGARGGNGVILVETKKGNAKKPRVTFSGYYGVQSLASTGDYLNKQEYAEYYNNSINYMIQQGINRDGSRGRFTDAEIAALPDVSWIEEISQEAAISDYHVGVSGGDAKTQYFISAGIFDQEGIIGKTDFGRKSLSVDLKTSVNENLDVNLFATYSNNTRSFIAENSENSFLMSSVASLPPIFPVYDENGIPFNNGDRRGVVVNGVELNPQAEFGNPIIGLTVADNKDITNVLYSNTLINWELFDGFTFSNSLGYLKRDVLIRNFGARFDWSEQNFVNEINSLAETTVNEEFLQWESYVTYEANLSQNHQLSLMAGTSVLDNESITKSRFGTDFYYNTAEEVNFANIVDNSTEVINNDLASRNTTLSMYGRAIYNYQEKYLFSATVRRDGSSRFGESQRWGVFPSVSAGWVLSSEPFLASVKAVELLKLRASWGINGNDRIAPYQYAQRYVRNGSGGVEEQSFNPDVKWESIAQTNVGLEANLFNNKVGITLDWYIKTTDDMLLDFPNPSFLGLPAPTRNAASVKNTGFEGLFLYRDKIGSDFHFNIGMNFGLVKNEITDLGGGLPIVGGATRVFQGAPALTISQEGSPIASFYGFVMEGLDEAGNPVYKTDENGDPVKEIIGNPYPDLIYGLNIQTNYKNFDFTIFFSGSEGNDVVNASTGYGFAYSNRTKRVLNAWSLDNRNSTVIRPSALEAVNHEFSDYYVEDGSYLRMRNITLGYTLPESILAKLKLENLRFYVSGNNLLTITDYSGYDPEIGANNSPLDVGIDRGFYPLPKSVMGGFQLTF